MKKFRVTYRDSDNKIISIIVEADKIIQNPEGAVWLQLSDNKIVGVYSLANIIGVTELEHISE
jgi:hypothetical protein